MYMYKYVLIILCIFNMNWFYGLTNQPSVYVGGEPRLSAQ